MKRPLLLLLAALAACKPGADGPSVSQAPLPLPATSLTGTVTDARTGAAIPGALVGLALGSGTAPAPSTPVDASGRFVFTSGVTAGGSYQVAAAAPGYVASKVTVLAVKDAVVRADLRLDAAPSSLVVTPGTLDLGLTAAQGTFKLTNDGVTTTAWQVVAPAPWITSVAPASGTLAAGASATVTLEVNRAQLAGFGAHSALLTVLFDGGARYLDLRLRNVDQNAPQLGYAVAALDFGAAQTALSFDVQNVGTGSLHWSVAAGKPSWVTFAPTSGVVVGGGRQTVTVTASRAGFLPSALVDAYFSLDSDSVVDTVLPIRAHLEVPGASAWALDKASLPLPAGAVSDVVNLSNTGTLPLDWQAAPAVAWVVASPASGRLLPGTAARVYVGADVAGRAAGPFSARVDFTSTLGTLPLTLSGTRVIQPRLEVPALASVETAGKLPVSGAAWVNNTGEGSISWTATSTTPWLTLQTSSGTSGAGVSCIVAPPLCGAPLAFTVDPGAIPDGGTQTGSITVSGAGQTGTITVQAHVRLASAHWDAARPVTPAKLSRTSGGEAAYDPVRDRLVWFRAADPSPSPTCTDCIYGTWEFDGAQWREVVLPKSPPLSASAIGMAYDRHRGVMVWAGTDTYGTWEYDGASWTKATSALPTTYYQSAPIWSPELRAVVMVSYDLTLNANRLFAFRGGTWVDVGAAPPVAYGQRLLNDATSTWSQLPSGAAYVVALADPGLYYLVRFGQPVRLFSNAVGYDPWKGWVYAVSADYVGGSTSSVGRLLGDNLRTGASLDLPVPADFGSRTGHQVVLDTARQRLVVFGGTYCASGCADYGRAVPTAFLDLQPPGVTYSEHPVLTVSASTLDFGAAGNNLALTLSNTGTGELDYAGPLPAGFSGDVPYAPLLPGAPLTVTLALDRSGFTSGAHTVQWPLRSDGGNASITLQFTKP